MILAFAFRAVKLILLFALWMYNAYNQFTGLSIKLCKQSLHGYMTVKWMALEKICRLDA